MGQYISIEEMSLLFVSQLKRFPYTRTLQLSESD